MTITDGLPVPPHAAQVAVLTAKHLRLLSRVEALAAALEGDLGHEFLPDVEGAIAELRMMAAEARELRL